jgi:drug/metabolite transporter (DMT)-like permease
MSEHNRGTALLLFIGLTLIWGTSFILIKQGLKVLSWDEVATLRVTAAAIFLLPVGIVQFKGLKTSDYWKMFASGMMAILIPAFLFSGAQTQMASSVAGILNALSPLFTMIIGAFIFNQKFKGASIIGIILGFGGAVVLALTRSSDNFPGFNMYALLIVLACIFYGANLNFVKFVIPNVRSLTITSVSVLLVAPIAAVYLFGFTDFTYKLQHAEGAWTATGFIIILGLMSTAVALLLFNRLVKLTTPLFASSVTYVMPVVAVLWGLLDGESIRAGHLIGMSLIIGGVYLANRKS